MADRGRESGPSGPINHAQRPPFRWQFSLRMLLILMAVGGVALTIFRWPWEETNVSPGGVVVAKRFRRGWNGIPLQHGLQQRPFADSSTEQEFYVDGARRWNRDYDRAGQLTFEQFFFPERGEELLRVFLTRGAESFVSETRRLSGLRTRLHFKTQAGAVLESLEFLREGDYRQLTATACREMLRCNAFASSFPSDQRGTAGC